MSRKIPFIVSGLVGLLLMIGLAAGVGFMSYRAGVAQGIEQAPQVAKAIEKAAESGQGAPVPPAYGYGYGYYSRPYDYPHHFGFFPIGSICFSIFILFFFMGMMKMMFFRRMAWARYGSHHGSPWMHHRHGWEDKEEGEKKDEAPEEKK